MKFKAVEFMRKARDQISKDIQDMSLEQEKKYLAKHSEWFTPNKSFQPTANAPAEFKRYTQK